jgi:hypothetical protein
LSSSPIWVSFLIVEATALLLQFGFRCSYYPNSSEYPFLLDFIESNETTLTFYVHLLSLFFRSDAILFSFTDRSSELILDLSPESIDHLLRLADIFQFPSSLLIEDQKADSGE